MIRFDGAYQKLAVGVAFLAGFVDAIGFLESGGFFVSFMTGNSTRLAVGAAELGEAALIAAAIILLFVVGVVAGSLVALRHRRRRTPMILFLVSSLLALALALRLIGADWPVIGCLAFAMGIANAALEGQDGAVIGVTYMTGTLVQMGQKIANALSGTGDGRWAGHLGLWLGLVGGAAAGASTFLWSSHAALAGAALLAAGLAVRAAVVVREE